MTKAKRLPTYFLSHGGGPWPWLEGPFRRAFDRLEASLREIPRQLGVTPKAILVISGHWEEREFTVMSSPRPPMVYDYGGFPEHTYRIRYEAPGAPDVSERVRSLLEGAGIPARQDPGRGFDHGTFAPLYAMYPSAEVPVLQLSLKSGYDPEAHLRAGRALAPLRDEGVLIVGSGLSYHNLGNFGPGAARASREFDDWLTDAVRAADPARRERLLREWSGAPSARAAHPREDHLVPLMVAVAAAEAEPCEVVYHEEDFFGGITVSSYRFGEAS